MKSKDDTQHKNDGVVVIDITDEKDPNLPDTSQKPVPISAKKLQSGQIYYSNNDRSVSTPYYQAQNVGSQPVYYQTGSTNVSRYPVHEQRNESEDNFRDEFVFMASFEEQEIRSKFVKRVYAILSVQLLFTCGFICVCMFNNNVREYVRNDILGVSIASFVEITIYFMLICYEELRRSFPINFILLGILTAAFAYITGALSTLYSTHVVILSVGITGAICVSVSLCACQTTYDITKCMPFLYFIICISLIYIIVLMILQIFLRLKAIDIVISGVIGLIFCLYLMFDTQMIMGGRRIQLSPEEYIFGALTIYVDIIQILWAVMRILGDCK